MRRDWEALAAGAVVAIALLGAVAQLVPSGQAGPARCGDVCAKPDPAVGVDPCLVVTLAQINSDLRWSQVKQQHAQPAQPTDHGRRTCTYELIGSSSPTYVISVTTWIDPNREVYRGMHSSTRGYVIDANTPNTEDSFAHGASASALTGIVVRTRGITADLEGSPSLPTGAEGLAKSAADAVGYLNS